MTLGPTDAELLAPLAGNIRRLRERAGMSEEDLAARAGVPPDTVTLAEACYPIDAVSLVRLAGALGATWGELFHP